MLEWLTGTLIGKLITTALISMLPIVELRGGIPLGVSMGLTHAESLLASMAGNIIVVPFLILFARQVMNFLRQRSKFFARLVGWLDRRTSEKAEFVRKYELIGLIILVAIPLPGTGAWTGALIAGFLDLRIKTALPAIAIGVLVAGVLVTGITYGFTSLIA